MLAPEHYAAIVATLLAGDVQARQVSNEEYVGVEVKLEDGGQVIWTVKGGLWVFSVISEDGHVVAETSTLNAGASPEDVAALIAQYEYGGALVMVPSSDS